MAQYSWVLPYYVTAGMLFISLFFLVGIEEKRIPEKKKITEEKRIGFITKNVLYRPVFVFLLFFAGTSIIDGAFCAYDNLNQIILKTAGYKVSMIGLFFSLSYFCNIFAYLFVNVLTAFCKRVHTIIFSLVLQCIGFFLLSRIVNTKWFFVVSLIVCFIPEVIFTVSDSIIQDYIVEQNRATILSIVSLIRSVCSGAIYGIFGVFLEVLSLKQFLLFFAIGLCISLFLAVVFIFRLSINFSKDK